MMTRAQKGEIIDGLKSDIESARAIILSNLIGVSANDSVAIRKDIREVNGKVVVTRNTLFAKAAKGTAAEGLIDAAPLARHLAGQLPGPKDRIKGLHRGLLAEVLHQRGGDRRRFLIRHGTANGQGHGGQQQRNHGDARKLAQG